MKLIIDIPESRYGYVVQRVKETKDRPCEHLPMEFDIIANGTPLEDVFQIIDNAKWMNKVLQGQSNIEADTPSCDTCKYQSAQFNPCNGCNDKSEYMPRDKE